MIYSNFLKTLHFCVILHLTVWSSISFLILCIYIYQFSSQDALRYFSFLLSRILLSVIIYYFYLTLTKSFSFLSHVSHVRCNRLLTNLFFHDPPFTLYTHFRFFFFFFFSPFPLIDLLWIHLIYTPELVFHTLIFYHYDRASSSSPSGFLIVHTSGLFPYNSINNFAFI